MPLRHETMLVKSEVYKTLGLYDKSYGIIADREWVLRLYKPAYTIYEIKKPILNFRTTGVSNTNHDKLNREKIRLLQDSYPFLTRSESELINSSRLCSSSLLQIANKYSDINFAKACFDLIRDRKTVNSKKWEIDNDELNKTLALCKMPIVSVILAVYNAESTLDEAITSADKQNITI